MEGELWGCRVYSGKHPSSCFSFSSSPAVKSSNLCLGGDEDSWEYFPCPFCYVDVEVPDLSSHLLEEHCFNTKDAVCPLCAANGGKDMIDHFSAHHSHMLMRRKPQRTSLRPSSEPHEINSYCGALLTNSWSIDVPDASPDPLLSSFIYKASFPVNNDEVKENKRNVTSVAFMSSHELSSSEIKTCNEVIAEDYQERSCRVEFVQQLILSTIFGF